MKTRQAFSDMDGTDDDMVGALAHKRRAPPPPPPRTSPPPWKCAARTDANSGNTGNTVQYLQNSLQMATRTLRVAKFKDEKDSEIMALVQLKQQ